MIFKGKEDFFNLGEKSCSRGNLKTHQKTHTAEGQIRHKKQERNLLRKLRGWRYAVDIEVTIRGKNGNCLDTNRHFSRLDFVVVNCTTHIHSYFLSVARTSTLGKNLSCEFSRMADVHASLILAGYTLPLHGYDTIPVENTTSATIYSAQSVTTEKFRMAIYTRAFFKAFPPIVRQRIDTTLQLMRESLDEFRPNYTIAKALLETLNKMGFVNMGVAGENLDLKNMPGETKQMYSAEMYPRVTVLNRFHCCSRCFCFSKGGIRYRRRVSDELLSFHDWVYLSNTL